mgnify:CR=1 FL=1
MSKFNSLNENGHLIIKNFLKKSEKKIINKAFFEVLSKYLKLEKKNSKLNFNNYKVHKEMINFRKKNPKGFADFYDELNLNSSLKSIFFSKKFIKLFAKILKTKKEFVYINGFMLRLDAPYDKRNSVDWHTDSFFFEQTRPNYNAGVCWLALTTNNDKNGSVKFISSSHKSQPEKLDKLKFRRKNKFSTYTARLSISKKEKKLLKTTNTSFGDAGIFDINLKHRSGKNTSKKIRISFLCRFHDASNKFNIGKEAYVYNKTNRITLKYK